MATKIRKQIYLEQAQDARLKEIVQQTGQSEAEIIRQALERHASQTPYIKRDLRAWEAERRYIQNMIEQGEVESTWKWKREELHDR